jgi:hypothetical protein
MRLMFRRNISPPYSGWKNKPSKKPAEADGKLNWVILGLLIDPEDGSDMFHLNFGLPANYTSLKPIRL